MERRLDRIMARLFDCPLLIAPDYGEMIARVVLQAAVANLIVIDADGALLESDELSPELNRFYGTTKRVTREGGLSRLHGHTGIVTINGELVNRGAWVGSSSGLVSYEGLVVQLKDVANDPEVRNVVLDINTPGGEAAGIEAAGEAIARLNEVKPVTAFLNSNALSAGQWLSAQAGEVIVTPSSRAGSIGVVIHHLDRSEQIAEKGVKVTTIKAGAHKTDFSPLGPLSKDALERMQMHVDQVYDRFCLAVAKGRGSRMKVDAVRDTEAMVYSGEDAVKVGLADRVMSFEDVLSELSASTARRYSPSGALATGKESGLRTELVQQTGSSSMDVEEAKQVAANATANAAKIIGLCNAAGFPSLAEGFLQAGTSVEDVEKRLADCTQIKAAVSAACKVAPTIDPTLSDRYINGGASLAHVNGQLMKLITDNSGPAVRSAHSGGGGSEAVKGAPETSADIQASWKESFTRAGAFNRERPAAKAAKMRG